MIGLAEQIEITAFSQERESCSEWAPYRTATPDDAQMVRRRFSGLGALGAFLLFSGITVGVARGYAGLAESYQISQESLLVAAWMLQLAAALFCFVLALRWLRS